MGSTFKEGANMRPDKRAVASAFVLLLFLAGCDQASQRSDSPPVSAEKIANSPSSPVAAQQTPVSLSQPFRYPDGLEVKVTGIQHGQLGVVPETDDPNAKEGDPYTVITVTLRNQGSSVIDAVLMGELRYGPEKTPAFRLGMHDDNAIQQLKPGQTSYPYDMGFLVPVDRRDDVNLQVNIDLGPHQPALFAGALPEDRG
jgi:hypothetical protein